MKRVDHKKNWTTSFFYVFGYANRCEELLKHAICLVVAKVQVVLQCEIKIEINIPKATKLTFLLVELLLYVSVDSLIERQFSVRITMATCWWVFVLWSRRPIPFSVILVRHHTIHPCCSSLALQDNKYMNKLLISW